MTTQPLSAAIEVAAIIANVEEQFEEIPTPKGTTLALRAAHGIVDGLREISIPSTRWDAIEAIEVFLRKRIEQSEPL